MAKLYFRYSAMNAGKSTAMLQVAHNYEEQGQQVRLFTAAIALAALGFHDGAAAREIGGTAQVHVGKARNLYAVRAKHLERRVEEVAPPEVARHERRRHVHRGVEPALVEGAPVEQGARAGRLREADRGLGLGGVSAATAIERVAMAPPRIRTEGPTA